jgi:hypothetical protein
MISSHVITFMAFRKYFIDTKAVVKFVIEELKYIIL